MILDSDRPPVVDAAGAGMPAPVPTAMPGTTTTAPAAAGAATTTSAAATAATTTSTTVPIDQITVPTDIDLAAAARFTTGMFTCVDGAPEDCILEQGNGPTVFLLGDSNAAILVPMFRQLAQDHDFTFAATTAAGCPWQQGLGWEVDDQTMIDDCVRTRTDAYERVIPALRPDVIVTAHVSRDDPARPSPPFTALDDSLGSGPERVAAATSRSLDTLTATGADVVLVEPFPYGSFDTVQCLSGVQYVIQCAFQGSVEPSPTEVAYRYEAMARPDVFEVDLDRTVCPQLPLCVPILDGELVYRDALHVYPPWLVAHRQEIWSQLLATGAFG
jgi:SGNH domain (fused to AT3 domains)